MPETNYELMYRRPGNTEHEKVAQVLDDILIRLEKLENSLKSQQQS